ncbi:DNA repair protein RecO [Sphingobacterium spiritivorum]|uniref:DNA repair protein RecO n=1 Tax=Sphingobacterium spiritivorum TaxID=258 RepID=UPI00191ABA05|nr:DNA repair protein RecO [Sphingobacterium spiritivorum]QQT27613.1 DNA repair protein RecO [Sphingobacterium spiritivorum]
MLHKTKGIALKLTNYSESSVVVQVYTESFGLQSYLVNGAKKPKAKIKANLFQPLHLLELIVYHKDNNNLQRISEAHQTPPLLDLPYHIVKSSIAIFLNEVLYKSLKQQQHDGFLFNFIFQSIRYLDETDHSLANFHLTFLIKLSMFLGFLPNVGTKVLPYFDLREGNFSSSLPAHSDVLQPPHTEIFHQLIGSTYASAAALKINKEERALLLSKILDFYNIHVANFGEINSVYILEEIFR